MKKTLSLLILAGSLSSGLAMAEGPAIIGAIGQATYDDGTGDESSTSFAIGAEYRFSPNFALQGRYEDYGEPEDSGLTASANSYSFAVKGGVPLGEQFNLYAKLGFGFWDLELSDTVNSMDYSGEDLIYGFGGEFEVSENVGIGAEYTMLTADVDGDDLDLSNLALTMSFKF